MFLNGSSTSNRELCVRRLDEWGWPNREHDLQDGGLRERHDYSAEHAHAVSAVNGVGLDYDKNGNLWTPIRFVKARVGACSGRAG
jgi:hypothetical protein